MNEKIDRFTLEENIMSTWGLLDDLQLFLKNYDNIDEDARLNILIGILQLGELKFATLWQTFETLVTSRQLDLPEQRDDICSPDMESTNV